MRKTKKDAQLLLASTFITPKIDKFYIE